MRWLSFPGNALLLVVFLTVPPFAGEVRSAEDDWPRYAHDPALTGHTRLRGKIAHPRTAWSFFIGGAELQIEIVQASGEDDLKLIAGETPSQSIQGKVARPEDLMLDLDGTGTFRVARVSYNERWGRILPDTKGWQRVAWNHTWTDQKVCRLQLFAYDQGYDKPRMVWQTDPPEDTIFQPLNIVSDIDGDGIPEVCVAAHYRVMIFDGPTGRKKTELRYHHSRPYGWFGLADVDGDGQPELVTIGDFQSHIDVLNYDPKKPEPDRLSVRWRRDIDTSIEERKKWLQVGPHPLVDVTADDRPEIVVNIFNDSGDGQWHTVVLNAATGEVLHDFARRFVQGSADVEGLGKEGLFLIATDGALVPGFGSIELLSFSGGRPHVLWSQERSSWATVDLPRVGTTWSTTAEQGLRQVLVTECGKGKHPAFLVAQRPPNAEPPFPSMLSALRVGMDGRMETLWRVSGLIGECEFIALSAVAQESSNGQHTLATKDREDPQAVGVSLRMRVPPKTPLNLSCKNAKANLVESRSIGGTLSSPIAARLRPNGSMTVVAEGAAQQIYAIQPPEPGVNQARLLWRRPGRGMRDGIRSLGPLAADLYSDGGNEIVVADQDATGRAQLVAYRHDGSLFWQTSFAQTPGAMPVWNGGALTFWWPGRFRSKSQIDLFVNTRRGLMHSDVGQLLDGRTGTVIWKQEKAILPGEFAWGYAGIPVGVADLDADGLDELISLYPVCFWVADGRTGRLRHGVELASKKKIPAWAAYGEPMIHEFTGGSKPNVLLDTPYILALLDTNGAPAWNGFGREVFPVTEKEAKSGQTAVARHALINAVARHALIDIDGDGTFEIASAGYEDGVRLIDPRDGKILWSLPAPAPTCDRVAAANIDGRKGDELIYVAGKELIAVTGDRTSGRILWRWQGPANLSMPAIADLNGNGLAEIVVQSADGTVHCIDSE